MRFQQKSLNHFHHFISVLFSEGDPVQFEAVPQEGNADDPASSYCSWFATLVWKGKRPPVEPYAFDSPYTTVTAANSGAVQQVKIVQTTIEFLAPQHSAY
jgi:hypothetical protein